MWSNPLLKAESPSRLEQHAWGLLCPTSETLWGWRFHSLSGQPVLVLDHSLWTFLSLYPSRCRPHLTYMHPTYSSGCPSLGNLFLWIIAWILHCAGTGVSYYSFMLSSIKWHKGMGSVCVLSPAQPSSEVTPKKLKHPWRCIARWWRKQRAGDSPGPSASFLCPIFVWVYFPCSLLHCIFLVIFVFSGTGKEICYGLGEGDHSETSNLTN